MALLLLLSRIISGCFYLASCFNMKVYFSSYTEPAFNLAAEEYLFSSTKDEILLLYVNAACVVIGTNQAVLNEVNLDFCIEHDIRVLRRLSGGGAVYHDEGNLNYCFIWNQQNGRSPLSDDFLNPIVAVLKALNIPSEKSKRKDLWLPDGFKISGTASHVSRGREMHHGTLLYDADLEALENALTPEFENINKRATASVRSNVKNIAEYLAERQQRVPTRNEFFHLFSQKTADYCSVEELSKFSSDDVEHIEQLKKMKYIRREWNYRM